MSSYVEAPAGGWYQLEQRDPRGPLYLVFANSKWLNDERLAEINDLLMNDAGWSLSRESDGGTVEPVVTPLLFAPSDQATSTVADTPQGALRALRGLEGKRRVWLDELLIDGMPAHKGGALTRGDFNRVPVTVLTSDPPPRRARTDLPVRRRPVIALLDTAIARHPWLEAVDPRDPIWLDAADYGCALGPRTPPPDDLPGPIATLDALDRYFGHGTFSAGVLRQVAPDATILLIRVMHPDGHIHGDHLLNALGWVRDEHDRAMSAGADQPETQAPGHYVDVICLPLGYEFEAKDEKFAEWLRRVLGELGERGVRIVASAGNEGTNRPTYPAAFAVAQSQPRTPLVSVGALNPNGRTRADYSNHGDWVTDWTIGTSVVSTFPLIDGPASPELGDEWHDMESVDPDDFTGGFSRWSGTSFAAAAFAGMLGQALLTPEAVAAQTPHERAEIALRACRQGA